ncbi:RNA ligase family protein [Mesorhizobium sp. M6A.T.Cr.TU.016.01.1.1]|uniref:ATP-dependent DNA ligase n=1 Tax=Mesorhizobium sp. M6A.T.Cr.TU.016.01.1.1 TaxID=2493677 RepID=UPI000F75ADB9|nr:RNA ligase family protein [Mesorhizobium sp. M6A.T.Cr.TU.016.01.1.1]AZO67679.1 ATP-dependent DNA ligase [Mesorhizobium sp. M6A.T.Cr.TU.016.01.1.1]
MRLAFIPPMKPKLVDSPPLGDGWTHEIKLDGYRTQIIIEGGEVRAYSSSGADWTKRYAGIVEAARELEVESAIIDGEAVVPDEKGRPDFHKMQRVIQKDPYAAILGAFDILHLNGHDLRDIGCKARREMLHGIVKPDTRIQFSEAIPGDAKAIFYLVEQAELEGVVSKRADSKYRSGPTTNWVKAKSFMYSDLDLIGYQRERGKAAQALFAEPGTGHYIGTAVITLGRDMRDRLWQRVQAKAGGAPPNAVMKKRHPATQWIKPGVRARVKHLRGEVILRHASVNALLDDGEEGGA